MKLRSLLKKLLQAHLRIFMASLFLASFFTWVFVELLEEIWIEKEVFPFDFELSNWMSQTHTPLVQNLLSFLTKLGGTEWMISLFVFCAGFLFFKKQLAESIILAAGFTITFTSIMVIKFVSNRDRPVSTFSLEEGTSAFPSGHMALSLFLYGFIAYLISRRMSNQKLSLYVMITGIVFAGLIGISRLYLNVHWLSDVLAGFALGASVLCLCTGLLELIRKR